MILTDLKIYSYESTLKNSFVIGDQTLISKQGLIICFINDEGLEGYGEIAPLAGRSHEDMDDCIRELEDLRSEILEKDLPDDIAQLNGSFEKILGDFLLSASVRFGIEMALLQIVLQQKNIFLHEHLQTDHHETVYINGLLSGKKTDVIKEAKHLCEEGFKGFKLKTGSNIIEDAEKIEAINQVIRGKAILHIDANQSMNNQQALELAKIITPAATDYIEEPFDDIDQIPLFYQESLIPVALDESLIRLGFNAIKSIEGVDVLILKPTLLGGIEKTWHIFKECRRLALRVVISSSFESSLGLWMLLQLASCNNRIENAGLDTLKWLETDTLIEPLRIQKGRMKSNKKYILRQDLNFDNLTFIS